MDSLRNGVTGSMEQLQYTEEEKQKTPKQNSTEVDKDGNILRTVKVCSVFQTAPSQCVIEMFSKHFTGNIPAPFIRSRHCSRLNHS